MKQIKIEGDKIKELADYLSDSSSSDDEICRARIVKEVDGKKVGFFVYENYYLRTQGTVSCSVFMFQSESSSCEISIVGSGGASAIGTTWGAHQHIEKILAKAILDFAHKSGMKADCVS